MGLIGRAVRRLRSDGVLLTLSLSLQYLLGVDPITLYNALRFREHKIFTSCNISTPLPKSTVLPHPVGVVVGHDVSLGENVRIQQNVTLGRPAPTPEAGYPQIGDDVRIGAGAVILGDIELGDGCVVGANAVVVDDVSEGTTVAGVPAVERD